MSFRPLSPEDPEAVLSRLTELFDAMYDSLQEKGLQVTPVSGGGRIWADGIRTSLGRLNQVPLAFDENELIAFAQGSLRISPAYMGKRLSGSIDHLYVHPEHRRSGIGERLIRELEAWFKEKKVEFIDLDVHWNNEAGIEFWHSIGYEEELVTCRKLL